MFWIEEPRPKSNPTKRQKISLRVNNSLTNSFRCVANYENTFRRSIDVFKNFRANCLLLKKDGFLRSINVFNVSGRDSVGAIIAGKLNECGAFENGDLGVA